MVTQDFAAIVERHRQIEAATTNIIKTCKKCEEGLQEMNKGRAKLREGQPLLLVVYRLRGMPGVAEQALDRLWRRLVIGCDWL